MKGTFNGFSGVDMQVYSSNTDTLLGTLQGMRYDIYRQQAPIYTMGHANPTSFARGNRTITGTLIFNMFCFDTFDISKLFDIIILCADDNGAMHNLQIQDNKITTPDITGLVVEDIYSFTAQSITKWQDGYPDFKQGPVQQKEREGQIYNAYNNRWVWL